MRSLPAVLLVISFTSIAVFGFLALGHANGSHVHAGCMAAILYNTQCPESNIFASLAFHMNAFRGFSTAIPGAAILFFAFALIVLFLASHFRKRPDFAFHAVRGENKHLREIPSGRLEEKRIRWLFLRERRDPALLL